MKVTRNGVDVTGEVIEEMKESLRARGIKVYKESLTWTPDGFKPRSQAVGR